MSRFAVPLPYLRGLRVLRDPDFEHARDLVNKVRTAAQFRSVQELEALIASALPDDSREDADDVLDCLLALRGQLRTGTGIGTALDVGELAERAAASRSLEIESEEKRALVSALLVDLLSSDAVATTAAAADLLVQHEHPYRASRIISDIRPVFSESVEDAPRGAVLVHILQIGYWNADGSPNAMDVALDYGELKELQAVIERAMTKAATLRRFLESSGVASFELQGES